MQIEKMILEDYEDIYALWMSCRGMGLNTVDDSKEGIARFLKRNPDTCFVAKENGRLIGVIMVGTDGRRGYIYHTAVAPSCRKRGIGSALVEAALKALNELGISKTALVVFAGNADGNAFWEKQGFTVRTDIIYRDKLLTDMVRIDT